MPEQGTPVRVHAGIAYGASDLQHRLESALEDAGYRVDSEMSLRHGLMLDIEWR